MAGNETLMQRARNWVLRNQCPLPLDLAVEMMGAGLDAGVIEEQLLKEMDNHGTESL